MNIKKVSKHWGHELWIATGETTPYALKHILFKAGNRTSLQVHRHKFETNYVLSGTGKLYKSKTILDIDYFLEHGMSSKEVEEYERTLEIIDLQPGFVFHTQPGYVHRIVATTDLEFIEASTPELDDVYRLQDDQGRTHGKIIYEHIKHTVVIPTAGLGSRLGQLSKDLNKALLPYNGKPIISHIIDQFPADTKFIIPVGYKSEQVKDFCKLAYSDRHIEFVVIDDYTSEKSGPGYTISKCLEKIKEPFWYIPCDTYFNELITDISYTEDVVFVKQVPSNISSLYTMFKIENNKVVDLTFKQEQNEEWSALTGVMYIHDWENFAKRLTDLNSPEIIWTIRKSTTTKELNTWQDFGNLTLYRESFKSSQKYDFTKTEESTYICNNKVTKWWVDPTIARKKYEKTLSNPKVYPANCKYQGNFLVYDYFDGTTVYENFSVDILHNMLSWLDKDVWIHKSVNISQASKEFYKEKTLNRINKFLEKYPTIEDVKTINGCNVKHWRYYLDNMNWDLLENTNLPGHVHGDLHFDNTVINDKEFKIIDWRHEFANLVEIGDIYYDLAKLSGGFIINYSKIKQNEFRVEFNNNNVTLTIPNIDNYQEYLDVVKSFVLSKGWNYDKVKLLIPVIFWNMAPLHNPPFDKFLWYLGIKLFEELGS